ncbi:hypothetical protein AX16_001635 [Volvariella volvacea WC 439]|nr:hypothetical protein AX16_001635 [Volvariella volvacea WC 439]
MLLASLFLAAFARALASPAPVTIPASSIPSPVCVVAAAITPSKCDPTRTRTIFDINDSWARVKWLKIRTTLYTLMTPEIVIMWAIRQRIMAGRIAERNKHRGWTRTHGFFVQMGGLMHRVERDGEVTYQVAGVPKQGSGYDIDWESIKIPRIPEKEIKDHGKGDILAKAIVVLQTTWFVAQCIARHAEGLTITEIELVTLAFATLNMITYGLWWSKPLNVGYPIYFDENGNRVDGPEEKRGLMWWTVLWKSGTQHSLPEGESGRQGVVKTILVTVIVKPFSAIFGPLGIMMGERGEVKRDEGRPTSVHPFYAARMNDSDAALAIIYGSVVGVLFGGIHLLGWNFQFSTITERVLWRTSSLILTIIPFILTAGYASFIATQRAHNPSLHQIYQHIAFAILMPTGFLGAPLYFMARVTLLVLAFSHLRALSDSAYQNVRWTEFIPHI